MTTDRCILRMLAPGDFSQFFLLTQNEGFRKFQITDYQQRSEIDALNFINQSIQYHERNGLGILGVIEKSSQNLIGICALKYLQEEKDSPVELMYRLSDQHWGKGYGLEIASALVQDAFHSLKLNTLVATVTAENITSKKILGKLGFVFQQQMVIKGHPLELHVIAHDHM